LISQRIGSRSSSTATSKSTALQEPGPYPPLEMPSRSQNRPSVLLMPPGAALPRPGGRSLRPGPLSAFWAPRISVIPVSSGGPSGGQACDLSRRGLSDDSDLGYLRKSGMPECPHAGRHMGKNRLGALIAVGNQKGGVGKTTNTVHLAAALGEKGYEVLIIDL